MRMLPASVKVLSSLLLSGLLFLNSCKIDEDLAKPTINPDYTIPLVYGSLNLSKLVKDTSFMSVDPEGYFKIAFSDTVLEQNIGMDVLAALEGDLEVPAFDPVITDLGGGMRAIGTQTIGDALPLPIEFKLKELTPEGGVFDLKVYNQMDFDLNNIQIELLMATKNGQTFISSPFNVPAKGEASIPDTEEMLGYVLDFSGGVLDSNNYVDLRLISDASQNQGMQVTGINTVFVSFGWKGLLVNNVRGKFPVIPLDEIATSNDLINNPEFFSKFESGSMNISGAEVKMTIDNTLGIPYKIDFNLETISGIDGSASALLPQVININSALYGPPPVTALNEFVLDDDDNLGPVISNFPLKMNFSTKITDEMVPGNTGYFIYKESGLKVRVDAVIPFAIRFNQLVLVDTLPFDGLSSIDYPEDILEIDTAVLTFKIINWFPYGVNLQIDATDDAGNVLTDLASIDLVAAQIDNTAGRVMSPVTVPAIQISMSQDKFNKLREATKMKVRATLDTPPGLVAPKIFTDYTIGFNVIGRIKANVKQGDN